MTREELIKHLEHLADYVKYSEDAPALREVIEMLAETRGNTRRTHACNLIDRRDAIDACHNYEDGKDAYAYGYIVEDRLKALPSAQLIDVQAAYYRGKIDGINECTARLKKINEEFANG